MLIVMTGLPGTGKSAVANSIGGALKLPVLSVDPIGAAMRRAGIDPAQPLGLAAYVVAETIASDILALGQAVVIDAVNAVEPARQMWRDLATTREAALRWIEVECSDPALHKRRLESRSSGSQALHTPSWDDVQLRRDEYEPWTDHRLVLDTTRPLPENIALALRYLRF